MRRSFKLIESELKRRAGPAFEPKFVIAADPWHKTFFGNLRDLVRRPVEAPIRMVSRPGKFWDDVFVSSPLPWRRFAESGAGHLAVVAMLWGISAVWAQKTRIVPPTEFQAPDVVYYTPQEYLRPLDTGVRKAQVKQKPDPAYAPQPIISVPPEADNRRQTIVTPPKIKLDRDVPLPNVVAWGPAQPTVPMAATGKIDRLQPPEMTTQVVAPPPEVKDHRLQSAPALTQNVVAPAVNAGDARSDREVPAPEVAVVAPPPNLETSSIRRRGDINIGHATVVAPAPQLPMEEQHAWAGGGRGDELGGGTPKVVAPPPTLRGSGISEAGGRMIALSVNPAPPSKTVEAPKGNRRGSFAATPEGKAGATGAPGAEGGEKAGTAGTSGTAISKNGIPPGLYVGTAPKSGGSTIAAAGRPGTGLGSRSTRGSVTRKPAAEMASDNLTEEERKVFAGRRSYAMTLSVPNLNSAGGSWVMHFVEKKDDEKKGDLVAPVATQTADPGYPLELMRENVRGTVTLAAVIREDGSVSEVQVLNSIDDRLDEYASNALSRWRFLPALKNGTPVALQTVVMIPFRPRAQKSAF